MSKYNKELKEFADNLFFEGNCRLIEASEEDIKVLQGLGLKFPNPDLALFEGTYLIADEANRNRHYISSESIEKSVASIKMKPVNYFHKREEPIGVYISSSFDKSTKAMRTVGLLWKSLFAEKVSIIEKLIKEGNAGQSFELTYLNKKVRPEDGSVELSDILFRGGAILPRDKAACRETSTEVLAKVNEEEVVIGGLTLEKGEVEKMTIEEILQAEETALTSLDNEKTSNEEFEKSTEELHTNEEETVEYITDAKKLTYQERQNLSDDVFAYVKTVGGKKIRRFPIQDEAHVRNALARLPQAKGLSTAEKATIKSKILKKAKSLGMTELLQRQKAEIAFTYEDILEIESSVRDSYKSHISPEKLEELIATRVAENLAKKAQDEIDKAKYEERRKTLDAFSDDEVKAFDILQDDVFDKLTKENQIKILQRNVSDLNWLKQQVEFLTKQSQPAKLAQAEEIKPEEKKIEEIKKEEVKVEEKKAEEIKIEEKPKEEAKIEVKVEEKKIEEIKVEEKKPEEKKVEEKKEEAKLLLIGMPKVVTESVKEEMKQVGMKKEK